MLDPRRLIARLPLLALLAAAPVGAGTFAYLHDRGDPNQVLGFELGKSGSLVPLACSPFVTPDPVPFAEECGNHCQTLTYARKPKLLLGSGPSGVSAWRVAKDGCLELVPGSPFSPASAALYLGVATAKRGRNTFVYVAEFSNPGRVHGFRVGDEDRLEELPSSPVDADVGPVGLVAAKGVLAAINATSASLSTWRIEKDGALTPAPGSPWVHGDLDGDGTIGPGDVDGFNLFLDQAGKRLYTGDSEAGRVFGFDVDKKTGGLTPLDANPLAAALANTGSGFALSKGKLLLGVSTTGTVQPFRRTKDGLEPLGGAQGLPNFFPTSFQLTANQRQLVLAGVTQLAVYDVDKKTGLLLDADPADADLTPEGLVGVEGQGVNAVVLVKR